MVSSINVWTVTQFVTTVDFKSNDKDASGLSRSGVKRKSCGNCLEITAVLTCGTPFSEAQK